MGTRQRKEKKWLAGAAAFIMPILLLLFIYAWSGVMPFGNKSILTGDCAIQYSAFLAYMKDILQGKASAYYTFSKVLGGDLAGFLSYYLLSPFNLVLLLFTKAQIQEAVLALTLLKTGMAGTGMFVFLRHRNQAGWSILLFSTAYALMGYNLAYQNNIMWLDGLVFLPFIVWGIEKMTDAGRLFAKANVMYLLSLSVLLLTNYYIGYMLCIFAVLYTGYYVFFDGRTGHFSGRERLRAIWIFVINSCMAGGFAAVTLLPTAFSLSGGKAAFKLGDLLDFTWLYSPLSVFQELFVGNYGLKGGGNTLPNIYCGILMLLLACIYFGAPKIARREKAGNALLLLALYVSFLFSAFDRIWHGTTVPAGSPHRYSFLFSFCLILMAYRGFCMMRAEGGDSKGFRNAGLLYGACLILYLLGRKTADRFVVWNVLLSLVYLTAFWRWKSLGIACRRRTGCITVLLMGLLLELALNGYDTTRTLSYENRQDVTERINAAEESVARVKKQDCDWYRMEQYGTNVTMNDAMLFQYYGLWSYSSCEKESTKRLAGKFGLNDRTWWITYHNEVPAAAESFLGLKYIVTNQPVLHADYNRIDENAQRDIQTYRNPFALPLGFVVNAEVAKTNFDTWDVLAIQNDLWKRMTGRPEDIYLPADREETRCEEHLIEYQLPVQEELPVYTCFRDFETVDKMTVAVNGREVRSLTPERQTYCLGTFQKGDAVTITITNETSDMSWYDLYFYYEQTEYLRQYSSMLQKQGMQLTGFEQDIITGTVDNKAADSRLLLLTVPADGGWTVLVDGIARPVQTVAGGFIGVAVEPGRHEIYCAFVPAGLWQGAAVSLGTVCLMIIMGGRNIFTEKRYGGRSKKNHYAEKK